MRAGMGNGGRGENGGRTESGAGMPAPTGVPADALVGGDVCDLVTVPTRQGLEAVDILRRGGGEPVGPVLHDDGGDTLGFLVPPGTADGWDVPGSTCTRTDGRGVRIPLHEPATQAPYEPPPLPNPTAPPGVGSNWLLPPGEADPATDPAALRAALDEAARLIEAADNCR